MSRIMVAGIGTDVGKTVVSAILTTLLKGDYWKPIQTGPSELSDTMVMKGWLSAKHHIYPPAYSLKAPVSPHKAASMENITLDLNRMTPPKTLRPLIIEGVGGILVPLNANTLSLDLFKDWNCKWVIVSKHYLGSINHTLMTLEVLKQHRLPLLGIVFNGLPNEASESVILDKAQLTCLGRLLPEATIDQQVIQRYAKAWQKIRLNILP